MSEGSGYTRLLTYVHTLSNIVAMDLFNILCTPHTSTSSVVCGYISFGTNNVIFKLYFFFRLDSILVAHPNLAEHSFLVTDHSYTLSMGY